jgi:hypothetical protein
MIDLYPAQLPAEISSKYMFRCEPLTALLNPGAKLLFYNVYLCQDALEKLHASR